MAKLEHKFHIILLLLAILLSSNASSNEPLRPSSYKDFLLIQKLYSDKAYRIGDTQIAWVNYFALRRDFSFLRLLSEQEIDHVILEMFSYISSRQILLNGIRNTDIVADYSQVKMIKRPDHYKRAALIEFVGKYDGMIDVKGIGHGRQTSLVESQIMQFEKIKDNPEGVNHLRIQGHSDGLMSLGEAIAEVTKQMGLQKLFDLHNHKYQTSFETIDSYFIISLPFEILKDNGRKIPAALYGRQAHFSRLYQAKNVKSFYSDISGYRQQSLTGSAVDMGGVVITDARLQQNFSATISNANLKYPEEFKPDVWAEYKAAEFYYGDDRQAVFKHLKQMLLPIDNQLRQLETEHQQQVTSNDENVWSKLNKLSQTNKSDVKAYTSMVLYKNLLRFTVDERPSAKKIELLYKNIVNLIKTGNDFEVLNLCIIYFQDGNLKSHKIIESLLLERITSILLTGHKLLLQEAIFFINKFNHISASQLELIMIAYARVFKHFSVNHKIIVAHSIANLKFKNEIYLVELYRLFLNALKLDNDELREQILLNFITHNSNKKLITNALIKNKIITETLKLGFNKDKLDLLVVSTLYSVESQNDKVNKLKVKRLLKYIEHSDIKVREVAADALFFYFSFTNDFLLNNKKLLALVQFKIIKYLILSHNRPLLPVDIKHLAPFSDHLVKRTKEFLSHAGLSRERLADLNYVLDRYTNTDECLNNSHSIMFR